MQIDVFTLFPQAFAWFEGQRHVANSLSAGHRLEYVNYRDHTPLSAGQVDDTPFGGGAGMVLRVDVVEAALRARYGRDPVELRAERRVIALSPGGRLLDDALVSELAQEDALTLLSGRYEGFDQRIVDHFASDEVSIGRYVLAGGELAAMVVCDAVLRKLPGRPRSSRLGARGVLQRGARRRTRVSALHAPGGVPGLAGARRASVRASRADQGVAPRAERGEGSRPHRRSATIGGPRRRTLRCESGPTSERPQVWPGFATS